MEDVDESSASSVWMFFGFITEYVLYLAKFLDKLLSLVLQLVDFPGGRSEWDPILTLKLLQFSSACQNFTVQLAHYFWQLISLSLSVYFFLHVIEFRVLESLEIWIGLGVLTMHNTTLLPCPTLSGNLLGLLFWTVFFVTKNLPFDRFQLAHVDAWVALTRKFLRLYFPQSYLESFPAFPAPFH